MRTSGRYWMPSVGDTLGRYELLARLRAGGMATLFLGKRVGAAGFARPVAIKVIHPHLADDPKFTRMFIDEAMLSAKIEDPHVVHVEELGEENGTYFLVMEYVPGASLAEFLRALRGKQRALSVEVAVWLTAQVAAGLHAAHEATNEAGEGLRIVHRDVSPQNVLLAFKGHVKLIDFGIAKAGTPTETQSGSLRGKVAYMPPEQALGAEVDRRADIYALGVVLWEMLTMRRLFEAENEFLLLEKVRHPKVTPPGLIVSGIPPALDEVVMKALAVTPELRIATADELRAMLLAAVPAASTKGSGELATLLGATMPDAIQKTREVLMGVLSSDIATPADRSLPPPPPDIETDVLETMTVALPPGAEGGARDSVEDASSVAVEREPRTGTAARPARRTAVVAAAIVVGLAGGASAFALGARSRPPPPPVESSPPPSAAVLPEAIPPPPPAVESAVAGSAEPSAKPAPSQVRRPTKAPAPRPGPRPATAPSGVEMHENTPIFKRGP